MKAHILFLSFLLALAFIPIVKADSSDAVSLTEFPVHLAEALGMSLFAGQILASTILLALFVFPTLILTRNQFAPLLVGFCAFGVTIALGWMPVYLLAVLTLIIAVMFGDKMAKRF